MYQYISDYLNEELARGNTVDLDTVKQAIDSYMGGAR